MSKDNITIRVALEANPDSDAIFEVVKAYLEPPKYKICHTKVVELNYDRTPSNVSSLISEIEQTNPDITLLLNFDEFTNFIPQYAKSNLAKVPLLISTGYDEEHIKIVSAKNDFDYMRQPNAPHILLKPFNKKQLTSLVDRILHTH
jgi:ABC-type branched-subunit amino acid transport system substrate-binding protein